LDPSCLKQASKLMGKVPYRSSAAGRFRFHGAREPNPAARIMVPVAAWVSAGRTPKAARSVSVSV
jgi:hypothetical protein